MQDAYLEFGLPENLYYKFRRRRTEPPSALRLAQLWLRDLTLDEEDRYIQNDSLTS